MPHGHFLTVIHFAKDLRLSVVEREKDNLITPVTGSYQFLSNFVHGSELNIYKVSNKFILWLPMQVHLSWADNYNMLMQDGTT